MPRGWTPRPWPNGTARPASASRITRLTSELAASGGSTWWACSRAGSSASRTSCAFLEIVPNERIVVDYGTPDHNDPDRFRMTVTFDEQADGKTVLTMRQLHPSRERRQAVIDFGAVEYGMQTLEGLTTYLEG
nr:SRPBCC domain-containing protein [Sphingomonas albertensis]